MFANMISPDALKAMLKGFGFDVEPLIKMANEIVASGKLEELLQAAQRLERIENKLDSLLQIEMERTEKNGRT